MQTCDGCNASCNASMPLSLRAREVCVDGDESMCVGVDCTRVFVCPAV